MNAWLQHNDIPQCALWYSAVLNPSNYRTKPPSHAFTISSSHRIAPWVERVLTHHGPTKTLCNNTVVPFHVSQCPKWAVTLVFRTIRSKTQYPTVFVDLSPRKCAWPSVDICHIHAQCAWIANCNELGVPWLGLIGLVLRLFAKNSGTVCHPKAPGDYAFDHECACVRSARHDCVHPIVWLLLKGMMIASIKIRGSVDCKV